MATVTIDAVRSLLLEGRWARSAGVDERMVTDCFMCGGETVRQQVTAEHWWGDDMVLFEHVPADVCRQCGERYYGAAVALRMDRLHQQAPATGRTVAIRIYDLAADAA